MTAAAIDPAPPAGAAAATLEPIAPQTAPPPTVAPVVPRLIGYDDVAKLLGIGRITVERHHARGTLPVPRRFCTRLV